MVTVDIREAETHLSKHVDHAARGESFVIAKAGKPLVRVAAIDAPVAPPRLGFLAGEIVVPDDFDRMGDDELLAMFGMAALTEGITLVTSDALVARYEGPVRHV